MINKQDRLFGFSRLSPHQQLDQVILSLVDSLMVQRAAKWQSSEEEEVVGAEVGEAWDRVHTHLQHIEWADEARGEAKALQMCIFYMENFLGVKLDDYHRRKLGEIVSSENPSWYNPE